MSLRFSFLLTAVFDLPQVRIPLRERDQLLLPPHDLQQGPVQMLLGHVLLRPPLHRSVELVVHLYA